MPLPTHAIRRALHLLTALGILQLLSGCPGDTRPPPQPSPAQQAQRLAADGDYTAAADRFQQLARSSRGGQATDYLMQAAHYYALAGDRERAQTASAGIDPATLTPPRDQAYSVLQAHLELLAGKPRDALGRVNRSSSLPPWSVAWLWQVQADAAAAMGNPVVSLRARTKLDARLAPGARKQANEDALWRTLQGLPGSELADLRAPNTEPVLAGWAALARSWRNSRGNPDTLAQAVAGWQTAHPRHPAAQGFTARLMDQSRQPDLAPGHIAVLLPTEGALAGPAGAIRDGILAAWYQDAFGSRPVLRFYTVPAAAEQVAEVYLSAVANGADLVIGPLRRQATQALADSANLQVPTLALNRIQAAADLPYSFYQFGLAPEDEAIAAAQQAAQQGYTQALILAPASALGDRVSNAFARAVLENHGTLLEEQRYDNSKVNAYSGPLKALLNIDIAEAKHRAMEKELGEEIRFDVTRRADAEFIFVYAYPADARQIVPQLAFYDAGNLPTFTTSHAFDGRPDRDLRGIQFATTPWQSATPSDLTTARAELQRAQPEAFAAYDRLYALGIDAYRLTGELNRLRGFDGVTVPGATGELSVDAGGRVHRQPLWAKVGYGEVTLIRNEAFPDASADAADSGTSADSSAGTGNHPGDHDNAAVATPAILPSRIEAAVPAADPVTDAVANQAPDPAPDAAPHPAADLAPSPPPR